MRRACCCANSRNATTTAASASSRRGWCRSSKVAPEPVVRFETPPSKQWRPTSLLPLICIRQRGVPVPSINDLRPTYQKGTTAWSALDILRDGAEQVSGFVPLAASTSPVGEPAVKSGQCARNAGRALRHTCRTPRSAAGVSNGAGGGRQRAAGLFGTRPRRLARWPSAASIGAPPLARLLL